MGIMGRIGIMGLGEHDKPPASAHGFISLRSVMSCAEKASDLPVAGDGFEDSRSISLPHYGVAHDLGLPRYLGFGTEFWARVSSSWNRAGRVRGVCGGG